MQSSRIASILRSVRELGEPIHAHGLSTSARALVVAHWARESLYPLIVMCADDDTASALASDIETLSVTIYGAPVSVAHLPTWEQSPYSPIAPSLRTRLARISALHAILGETPPKVIVTSIAGSCQATMPKKMLQTRSVTLRTEESIESRERLIRLLLEAGYLRMDPVEDPGTFAVRGDIVDVFPPDREKPLRVELFGDVVERIRDFDPTTQRATANNVPGVVIPPAREVLINTENASTVREKLKERADDSGISRAVRDPILASIQDGIYPEHSDVWAAFTYPEPESFWNYIPKSWPVIWNDELSCEQEWDRFLEEQQSLVEESGKSGVIVPAVDSVFLWTGNLDQAVRDQSRLYLDRIEFANLETPGSDEQPEEGAPSKEPKQNDEPTTHHRVFVRPNTDLGHGSRHSLGDLEPKFQLWLKQGFNILALASTKSQAERIRYLLEERHFLCRLEGKIEPKFINIGLGGLTEGFRWPTEGLVIVTESEILGTKHTRKQRRSASADGGSAAKNWSGLQALSDLSPGDAIVHVDHGIGLYRGLARLNLSGAPSDFLLLEYANKDKLYLPVYRLNVIQKYVGAGEGITLDRLGTQQFAKAKEKVRDAVKKLAVDLVQLYAERKIRQGFQFSPRDAEFREFEAKFPFDETPDQIKAIEDTLTDLETGKIMDRLVCGDVGYGKTEVAMRAAFKAVSDGKQVAILVPTTILAHQHEQSFKTRMKDYPLIIESLSRFKNTKEQKAVLESLAGGKVDIIIGTHRLLSRDVKFSDLGLVIVDEEHRFGVEHKEKLKALKINTPVLTLTATPIPRTLHMALSGLRDISLMNTAPVDRLPIRTYVSKNDDLLIQRAIEFEINRGGQVFFLHNRVQSIHEVANRIRALAPHTQITIAHGQMSEKALEEAMMSFYQRRSNVLVCTTIIESGLDLPSANTIIISRADSLGLAQLYQIRGRVGRGQQRAYAYLLIPAEGAVTEQAKKRLEVIQRFVELGSGFNIASHDLEIRGGGDLLGPQQSGYIAAVGFDLYTELLEEAIREIEGKPLSPEESSREPEIKAPFPAFLSEEFVPDVHQRLSMYRRLSAARKDEELDGMEAELRDRFGAPPSEAQNLLWLIRIKLQLKRMGIDVLTVGPEKVSLTPGKDSRLDPTQAISLISGNPHQYQLMPDSKFVARVATGSLRDLYFALETLFKKLG